MIKIEDYNYPKGLHLLRRWQSGDQSAKTEMVRIFDAAINDPTRIKSVIGTENPPMNNSFEINGRLKNARKKVIVMKREDPITRLILCWSFCLLSTPFSMR